MASFGYERIERLLNSRTQEFVPDGAPRMLFPPLPLAGGRVPEQSEGGWRLPQQTPMPREPPPRPSPASGRGSAASLRPRYRAYFNGADNCSVRSRSVMSIT